MTGRRGERGVALLLAIFVVALLTLTVLPFFYDGRVERAIATNLYTGLQASYLARSGVVLAEALLREDARESQDHDSLDERWAAINGLPLGAGGGNLSITVTDEQGKLNVNQLKPDGTNRKETWESYLRRLLALKGQDPSLVEPLVDWLDEDDRPLGFGGAEATYYLGLTPPYRPADGALSTIAELRMIKGWEPEVVAAVAPFLTIYGNGRVNINTAPLEVLVALGLDESQAGTLVEYRSEEGHFFRNLQEVRQISGLSASDTENLDNVATFTSTAFSVVSTGGFRDSTSIVRAVLLRSGEGVKRVYWRTE